MTSIIPRRGNKIYAWKDISGIIFNMASQRNNYCEPFLGSGFVLKKIKSEFPKKRCLVGDIDNEIGNFYINYFYNESFREKLSVLPYSKGLFDFLKDLKTEDSEIRALKEYYLTRTSVMSKKTSFKYKIKGRHINGYNDLSLIRHNVTFINEDFDEIIKQAILSWDEDIFYFCDPPYYETDKVYKQGTFDHERLRNSLKGKYFAVTYDDCDYIRELYKGCIFIEYKCIKMSISDKKGYRSEILIVSEEDDMCET